MKKISRERFEYLKQKHYELWNWLAKNPDECKANWPGFEDVGEYIEEYCFACHFDAEMAILNNSEDACDYCPLGKDNIGCADDGLYVKWYDEYYDMVKKSKLAERIRDLPWSEEYVED